MAPGSLLSNKEICDIFRCSTQGGMRRSKRTNTLLLISDHVDPIYEDRWIKDILYYTGMGLVGDQNLNYSQNKTLAESNSNGVTVYLFEIYERGKYTYQGEISLVSKPYTELQPDKHNDQRKVYIFPLQLKNGQKPALINEKLIVEKLEKQEKKVRHISNEELLEKIKSVPQYAGQRQVSSSIYERNPLIAEYARRRANGICELCEKDAPFRKKDNTPYLEIHHIEWLSKGGRDAIENTVALCPNCHKKMHLLSLQGDIKILESIKK